jgi:hypothetical protein
MWRAPTTLPERRCRPRRADFLPGFVPVAQRLGLAGNDGGGRRSRNAGVTGPIPVSGLPTCAATTQKVTMSKAFRQVRWLGERGATSSYGAAAGPWRPTVDGLACPCPRARNSQPSLSRAAGFQHRECPACRAGRRVCARGGRARPGGAREQEPQRVLREIRRWVGFLPSCDG